MNQVSTAQSAAQAEPTIEQIVAETQTATQEVLRATLDARRWALEPKDDEAAWRTAERICTAFNCTPGEAYARVTAGREIGIGSNASMRGIRFIKGNQNMMAVLKRAILLSRPDKIEYLRPKEVTALKCTYVGKRVGPGQIEQEFTFTIEDAILAGLVDRGKDQKAKDDNNYNKYPKHMLIARASSALCDTLAPDLLFGFGTTEIAEEEASLPVSVDVLKAPPQAAPQRSYTAELDAYKVEIRASTSKSPDELKALRGRLKEWSQEAPESLVQELTEFYSATIPNSKPAAQASAAAPA